MHPYPQRGALGQVGAGILAQGRGWRQWFEDGGGVKPPCRGLAPASCAFLGPEIPFQMDNSIVDGEKGPLVRIRIRAFGD